MSFSAISKKTGKTYYLHSKEVERSTGLMTIYFFRTVDSDEGLKDLPEGYEVWEMPRSGLPMLRRIK